MARYNEAPIADIVPDLTLASPASDPTFDSRGLDPKEHEHRFGHRSGVEGKPRGRKANSRGTRSSMMRDSRPRL